MDLRRPRPLPAIVAVTVLLSACGGSARAPEPATPPAVADAPAASAASPTEEAGTTQEPAPSSPAFPPVLTPTVGGTVAEGLQAPWGIAFLPDGSALVSERDTARVQRVSPDGVVEPVGAVPGVDPGGEGGLLGIALRLEGTQPQLYAYLTAAQDNRVVRMDYTGTGLGAPEVVLEGIPKGRVHNGGRIAFGPDDMLYVATGDSSDTGLAQDPGSLGGKILRVAPDGEPAPGNPSEGSPVWTLGHRNVQGLAFDTSGRLWASEFGQDTYDELNLIQPGGNYGWPDVEGAAGQPGFVEPVATWSTDEASPSGLAVAGGSVWMAGLRGQRLWQVPLPDGVAGAPRSLLDGELGRLRDVAEAPDGSLWVLTNNTDGRGDPREGDDRIVRVGLD